MKLIYALIFVFLLVPGVLAANIAYVVKNPASLNDNDIAIKNALIGKGHSVSVLDDVSFNASLYSVVIVSLGITDISGIFDNKLHKTLFLSKTAAKNKGLGFSSGLTSGRDVFITDNQNLITKNLSLGSLIVYADQSEIDYLGGCKPTNSKSLAYRSSTGNSVLLLVEKDSMLINGSCTKKNIPIYERNLFFGLIEASEWNPQAKQLFLNSIKWLIEGEDRDGDGFFTDEDCNDNNKNINPNATEIAYDGIDQNCDGIDLTDVDEDGYDAVIVGGDDCNDNDNTINPGSTDIYKNCINDAPFINTINRTIVYELEEVIINIFAIDPENNSLTYSINDSRFIQDPINQNIFTWETGYDDAGNYVFKAIVSDGNLSSTKEFRVDVRETNQAPVCNEIPALEWLEDSNASLNLNDYCSDPDGNKLFYFLQNTSTNRNIILESLENGIANFSVSKNWFGQDWVVIGVYDGLAVTPTNEIILKVDPVNDAPVFNKNISSNISWEEDKNLINYLDLFDYFSDVDSELNFSVFGNSHVNISIDNGLVSFRPEKDWFGVEIIKFTASDGEFTLDSNDIILNVSDVNEPPEFEQNNCETNLLEDNSYGCELNASDFEGDNFEFEIINESNLNCEINGNNLEYVSKQNYFGNASCLLRVSDEYGYSEYLFKVSIKNVNDVPIIKSYSPNYNPRLLVNQAQLFSVNVNDIDSNYEITWFVENGEITNVGNGGSYLFSSNSSGNYKISAVATDYEFNVEQDWDVFVGNVEDFTCSEVNGYECNENQVCSGSLLGVHDTNNCCSIPCSKKPPEFKDIRDKCTNSSNNIDINIGNPNKNEKFMIGDTINLKLDIKNRFSEDLDFDVNAYLYDLTEDSIVDDLDDSVSINENDKEKLKFEFLIPNDLDDSHDYALFVNTNEEDDQYCNSDYVEINVNRENHDVVIEDFIIDPEEVLCGDYINIDVKLQNQGKKNENVVIKIENPKLNITEETEEFKLEKYDNKDKIEKTFSIKIPENIEAGTYELKLSVLFNDKEIKQSKNIIVKAYQKEEQKIENLETINLIGEKEPVIQPQPIMSITQASLITTILLIIFFLIVFIFWIIVR